MPDYSSLPSVTALASIPELAGYPELVRIQAAKEAMGTCRLSLESDEAFDPVKLVMRIAALMVKESIQNVFNMSGVILHTGLGRAPLNNINAKYGYQNIEFDLDTGKRGDRQDHVRKMLCELTGAEDSLVVNNAAAAVMLALMALCKGKQVLLSRGQSVEIGGSFRMPEIIKASGCKLVDVGATNKTYVSDYLDSVTPQTAAMLRCHPSNYEISGFVSEPTTKELVDAARSAGVLMINDQGNGAMIDFARYGIRGIETLPSSVADGADISIASGDKLLGGPQCGIIVGRKDLIKKIAKHPVARAVRIDKISLTCLEEILRKYQFQSLDEIPLHAILAQTPEMVREVCQGLAPDGAEIQESRCELGSGSGAGKSVPSYAVVLKSKKPDKLLADLRKLRIIGRIEGGAVWLDPRSEYGHVRARRIVAGGMAPVSDRVRDSIKKQITECWEKWK